MFHYNQYCKLVNQYSEEKVKTQTICNWYGNTIFVALLAIFLNDILFFLLYRFHYYFYLAAYFLLFFFMIVYLCTRKAGVGFTAQRMLYVQFHHFGIKIKHYYEIPFEVIRSISVRKILNTYFISVSFIDSSGKLEKRKFYFAKRYIGFNSDEIIKNRLAIVHQLMEMQKVMDRGDF